jgi:3-oxoacyl-[acyl-carrier protein] reductase
MELRDAVAVVTGGGTGIGQAICRRLVQAGAAGIVVNYSRSEEAARGTARELSDLGAEAEAIQADVSDASQVAAMVASAVRRFGRLDVLVNNAGRSRLVPYRDLEALTDEDWDATFAVNVKGAFHCSRAAAPELRRSRGAIVNVASIAGYQASGSSIPYGVSKAALLQLTRALAVALAPEVRVNAVAPGLVRTGWLPRVFGERAQELERVHEESTPLGAIATPDDVAQAVLGLLQSDFVTGQAIVVDGGRSLA